MLAAARPEQAIELAQRQRGRIQLLLTDMIMPGMDGRQLAEKITAIVPDAKGLFISGYAADALPGQGLPGPELLLLSKPTHTRQLAAKIRSVLDAT